MPKKSQNTSSSRATSLLRTLVSASMLSTSRFEDRYWEDQLQKLLHKHLAAGQNDILEAALDELAEQDSEAADSLLEHLQAACQSVTIDIDGHPWQAVLMTSALAIWTRYQLPQVELSGDTLTRVVEGLKQTVLTPSVKVAALPKLVGLDEMPRSFSETYQWLTRLANRALGKRAALPGTITIEPNPALLVDTRHLVFVVAVPAGEPVFRWQAEPGLSIEKCFKNWSEFMSPLLAPLLPGCRFDVLTPHLYHTSVDLSEQHMRIVAIHSASDWLHTTLNLKPGELRATIAAVGEHGVKEYRVGYHRGNSQDVIYGTIWPIFDNHGASEDNSIVDTVDEIAAVLKEQGVTHVKRIPGVLEPETCEDCGAPFFPDPSGELVHVDLPEEAYDTPQHFH